MFYGCRQHYVARKVPSAGVPESVPEGVTQGMTTTTQQRHGEPEQPKKDQTATRPRTTQETTQQY